MTKLEYVLVTYTDNGNGDSIICYYADGSIRQHNYSYRAVKSYIARSTKFYFQWWCISPYFTADHKPCTLFSFVSTM